MGTSGARDGDCPPRPGGLTLPDIFPLGVAELGFAEADWLTRGVVVATTDGEAEDILAGAESHIWGLEELAGTGGEMDADGAGAG